MRPELLDNPAFLRYYRMWQANPASIVFVPIAEYFLMYNMTDKAIRVLETGLTYHPDLVSARLALGRAYMASGALKRAREQARHVLRIKPDNKSAVALLQDIRVQEEQQRDNDVPPSANTGQALVSKLLPPGARDGAVAHELYPAFSTVTMARLYSKQGCYDKARSIYEDILSKDPSNQIAREELEGIIRRTEAGQ